jgi:hypothetical protein
MVHNALQATTIAIGLTALTLGGCSSDDARRVSTPPSDNPELTELHDADQGDRSTHSIDWAIVSPRDSLRRVRVAEILDSGGATTSMDFYHAAMVFQHGDDTTAARLAHALAEKAAELDPDNGDAKWLTAAAWDRYLMRKGEPQWYGTQYVGGPGAWRLYDIDTTVVTDSERVRLGVGTLEQSRARVLEMNAEN